MDVMEDIGFYCIDNIPPKLINQFVDLCRKSEMGISKIAVAVDIRTGDMFAEIFHAWQKLKAEDDVEVKVLFIEANDEVLIKRYKYNKSAVFLAYLCISYCKSFKSALFYQK